MEAILDLTQLNTDFPLGEHHMLEDGMFCIHVRTPYIRFQLPALESTLLGLHTLYYGPGATHYALTVLRRYHRYHSNKSLIPWEPPPVPTPPQLERQSLDEWNRAGEDEDSEDQLAFQYAHCMTLVFTKEQFERLIYQLALAVYVHPAAGSLFLRAPYHADRCLPEEITTMNGKQTVYRKYLRPGTLTPKGWRHRRERRERCQQWARDAQLPGIPSLESLGMDDLYADTFFPQLHDEP